MTDDLVSRLEDHGLFSKAQRMALFKEAKAEIIRLRAALSPLQGNSDQALRVIRQMVEAYDSGNLQMSSPEISEPDIPCHPWHEELLHYARLALSAQPPLQGIDHADDLEFLDLEHLEQPPGKAELAEMLKRDGFTSRDGTVVNASTFAVIDALSPVSGYLNNRNHTTPEKKT